MKKKTLAIIGALVSVLALSTVLMASSKPYVMCDMGGKEDGAFYTDDNGHFCCGAGNVRDCDDPAYVKCK